METKNIYTVFSSYIEFNDKLYKSLHRKLQKETDPINLIRYLEECCMKCYRAVDVKNITAKHIPALREKFKLHCKTMRGGSGVQTSEWFGETDAAYSTDPNYTQDVLNVNLDGTIARPEISPMTAAAFNSGTLQQGGAMRKALTRAQCLAIISKHISSCGKRYGKTMDKKAKDWLSAKILENVECLSQKTLMKQALLKMPKA